MLNMEMMPMVPKSDHFRNANRDRSHAAPLTLRLPNTNTSSQEDVVFADAQHEKNTTIRKCLSEDLSVVLFE